MTERPDQPNLGTQIFVHKSRHQHGESQCLRRRRAGAFRHEGYGAEHHPKQVGLLTRQRLGLGTCLQGFRATPLTAVILRQTKRHSSASVLVCCAWSVTGRPCNG